MWIRLEDKILVIDPIHTKDSSVCNAYNVITPLQAMEQFFGLEHGFPQLCRDLAQHRNFDWLQWRDPLSEPPINMNESLEYEQAIKTLREQFDIIFKPCIVEMPHVHPNVISIMVNMLKDIRNPPSDMYDSLIKSVKLKHWRDNLDEETKHFLEKYSTLPLGHLVQVIGQAYVMELTHLMGILLVILKTRINLWYTEKLFKTFNIPSENNESATVHLDLILKPYTEVTDMCP
jgi:hypothetical protein